MGDVAYIESIGSDILFGAEVILYGYPFFFFLFSSLLFSSLLFSSLLFCFPRLFFPFLLILTRSASYDELETYISIWNLSSSLTTPKLTLYNSSIIQASDDLQINGDVDNYSGVLQLDGNTIVKINGMFLSLSFLFSPDFLFFFFFNNFYLYLYLFIHYFYYFFNIYLFIYL